MLQPGCASSCTTWLHFQRPLSSVNFFADPYCSAASVLALRNVTKYHMELTLGILIHVSVVWFIFLPRKDSSPPSHITAHKVTKWTGKILLSKSSPFPGSLCGRYGIDWIWRRRQSWTKACLPAIIMSAMEKEAEFGRFAGFKGALRERSTNISGVYEIKTSEMVGGYRKQHLDMHIAEKVKQALPCIIIAQ